MFTPFLGLVYRGFLTTSIIRQVTLFKNVWNVCMKSGIPKHFCWYVIDWQIEVRLLLITQNYPENYPVIMLHNKLFLDNDFRNKHNYWE